MRQPLFKKVCIVGVGLIGGSIGMAIKKRQLAGMVIGVVRKKSTIKKAFQKKALDVATLDLKEGVKDADLIVLAAPVFTIIEQIRKIAPHLKKGAVLIDVGSSKTEIVEAAKKHLSRNVFIGCHPMAGSERSGVEYARADLFKNSICFLTSRHPRAETFWKALGAKTVLIDPEKHDAWVAKASHMPHLLSFALFQNTHTRSHGVNPSLRDLARLSQSDPRVWSDIFLSNGAAITKEIKSFFRSLSQFESAIRNKKAAHLMTLLRRAKRNATVDAEDGR